MNNIISLPYIRKKENLSEERLIKKSIKGDGECFEELVKKYKFYLYKVAYSYTKNEDKALDLIQECTYRAWKNIKNLKQESSFKPWISKILVNIAITTIKKESKIIISEIDENIVHVKKDISIEEKVDIHEAIDTLKPEYKMVIILKYFDDMTIEEIAYVMEIPINTVKSHLRRARQSMKNILKEDYLYE
ncbi:sigma-70 family RNA polymerase sigma factor [Faecalimicrobium sp. JNUCC 81]